MVKAQATAEQFSEAPVIFDRGILLRNTMDDLGLATEVLALFEAQLQRLELPQVELQLELQQVELIL